MLDTIKSELAIKGYSFMPGYLCDHELPTIVSELGEPLMPWEGRMVQSLVPRSNAAPNTYSGIYGLGRFPFHTDLAHWRTPPRYFVLRCITGYDDLPTLLIDGREMITALTPSVLGRAIFRPRRPRDGKLPLLCLYEVTEDECRLRWDEVFLKPASRLAENVKLQVTNWLMGQEPISVSLAKPCDTLIVDNWRMLHARSPVPIGREDREIERVYLGELH